MKHISKNAYHFIVIIMLLIMAVFLAMISFDIKTKLVPSGNGIGIKLIIKEYSSIISSVATFVLGVITVCVQHKYQKETREDRRLSFQPFFFSCKKTVDANEFNNYFENENTINLSDYQPNSLVDDSDISKTVNNLFIGKKYSFFSYHIKNVGRDSAINITISFNDKSIYILSKQKSEEETFYVCISPNLSKEMKIVISYKSLDDENYIQEEKIRFDDSFKKDETIPGWEFVGRSFLSNPRQISKL